MQNNAIVAGIAVVLMSQPVAGTHVKFDVADRWLCLPVEVQHSIPHIWPGGTAMVAGEYKLAGASAAQGQAYTFG